MLAAQLEGVDPTDIILLNQNVTDIGFRVLCLDVTVRVLASNRKNYFLKRCMTIAGCSTPVIASYYATKPRDQWDFGVVTTEHHYKGP